MSQHQSNEVYFIHHLITKLSINITPSRVKYRVESGYIAKENWTIQSDWRNKWASDQTSKWTRTNRKKQKQKKEKSTKIESNKRLAIVHRIQFPLWPYSPPPHSRSSVAYSLFSLFLSHTRTHTHQLPRHLSLFRLLCSNAPVESTKAGVLIGVDGRKIEPNNRRKHIN